MSKNTTIYKGNEMNCFGHPEGQGMYRSDFEHSSCGIGFRDRPAPTIIGTSRLNSMVLGMPKLARLGLSNVVLNSKSLKY